MLHSACVMLNHVALEIRNISTIYIYRLTSETRLTILNTVLLKHLRKTLKLHIILRS